ncbi:hypothetical protein MUN78_16370 [Leucobacter allii]|uniref:HTH cro/C1-type domain-containing protein n=1 Tax=Leucobacter allii TaxID=2932247 RepID=A0ABY4FLS0_9MICO|nr:helix-turn-helix domain-containing protein [Leucobacter allii]UOQ57205.1 hypothetical protein MUN78_16370 [Leucobacter allii]
MGTEKQRNLVAGEVRAAIARAGKRQSDICRLTGFSSSRLSNKLRGESPFTVDELFIIAAALEVPARSLLPRSVDELGAVAA